MQKTNDIQNINANNKANNILLQGLKNLRLSVRSICGEFIGNVDVFGA